MAGMTTTPSSPPVGRPTDRCAACGLPRREHVDQNPAADPSWAEHEFMPRDLDARPLDRSDVVSIDLGAKSRHVSFTGESATALAALTGWSLRGEHLGDGAFGWRASRTGREPVYAPTLEVLARRCAAPEPEPEPEPAPCGARVAAYAHVFGPSRDLSCDLPAGHEGSHRDDTAKWTDSGSLQQDLPVTRIAWTCPDDRPAATLPVVSDGALLLDRDGVPVAMAQGPQWAITLERHAAAHAGLGELLAVSELLRDALATAIADYGVLDELGPAEAVLLALHGAAVAAARVRS